MLADPRASALVDPLRVAVAAAAGSRQDPPGRAALSAVRHDARPTRWSRETELLFDHIVREDRDVLELLTRRLHLRERAARAALRHPERQRPGLPQGRAGRSEPPRPLRAGQHPDDDVGRGSDVAGAARQVGARSAARHAAAAAAAGRAGLRGDEGVARLAAALGPRAHGGAPRQPAVPVVPPRDRSARARARELRRRRHVAHPRRRHRHRRVRDAVRRHAARRPGGAAHACCSSARTSSCARSRRT